MPFIEDLPHIKQQKPNWCGAACLEMALRSFDIQMSQQTIWRNISFISETSKLENCSTDFMVEYFQKQGICAEWRYDFKPHLDILSELLPIRVKVIVLYHRKPNIPKGHFAVISGFDEQHVYLNDPWQSERRRSVSYKRLIEAMAHTYTNDDIVRSGTAIIVPPPGIHVQFSDSSDNP